jgi:hypothetical protein
MGLWQRGRVARGTARENHRWQGWHAPRTQPSQTLVRSLGKGERETIARFIGDDEPVVGRHYAWEVSNQDDGTLLKDGAVIVSTDRKLLLVSARGTFRPKFSVKTFEYGELMPGVGTDDTQLFGQSAWYSGFGLQRGGTFVVRFFTKEERDEFVRDVGGALGGWHIIHGNA